MPTHFTEPVKLAWAGRLLSRLHWPDPKRHKLPLDDQELLVVRELIEWFPSATRVTGQMHSLPESYIRSIEFAPAVTQCSILFWMYESCSRGETLLGEPVDSWKSAADLDICCGVSHMEVLHMLRRTTLACTFSLPTDTIEREKALM